MSEPRLVDPRPTGAPVGGPPDNEALPDDLALEAAGRLRAACLVLGSLWTVLLVVNHLVAPYLGLPQGQVIPWPPVANVLALGARVTDADLAIRLLDIFLDTPFAGGRHQRRIDKIAALDQVPR